MVAGTVKSGGAEIHYEYYGRREKPPIVLLNAMNQTTKSWQRYLPQLLERADVVVWDYRGQGSSTIGEPPYALEHFADDLSAIARRLELPVGGIHLLAVCFGSISAAEYMRRHPGDVRKAVLSGAMLTREEAYINQRLLERRSLAAKDMEQLVGSFFSHFFSGGFQKRLADVPEHKQAFLRRISETFDDSTLRLVDAQIQYLERVDGYREAFAKVDVPVHVIAGEEDAVTPTYCQKKLLSIFPRATYREYPRCGHLAYVENEKAFFDDALDFLLS
jgi:pimeloyl-ACP methyl ester carboxylesterase